MLTVIQSIMHSAVYKIQQCMFSAGQLLLTIAKEEMMHNTAGAGGYMCIQSESAKWQFCS